MWGNKVECPYCDKEVNVGDSVSELDSNNQVDWECPHCEEEFELTVEFEPSYSADKIIYEDCQCCGKSTRDIKRYGRVFPFPKVHKGKNICQSCWQEGLSKEYEAKRAGSQS